MYSLLWLALLASSVLGDQPDKTPFIKQYIREHLKKFVVDRPVDEQIDPCDNFFTHVCPTTIRKEESPRERAASQEFIDHLDKLVTPTQVEKETNLRFLRALRHHIAIMKYLNDDESLKMLREQFERMTETIISQVNKSWPDLQNSTVDDLRHTVARQNFFSGLINVDVLRLEHLLESLNGMYAEVKEKSEQTFAKRVIDRTISCLLTSHGICLSNHMKTIFDEFVNDETREFIGIKSGNSTYAEDSPDFEGLHSAYFSLVNTPGIDMEEIPYKELGFTRRKLFYYAYASLRCTDSQDLNRIGGDHSPSFVRDAADPTKCNHLGEALRKK
ncbi:unnamed protein product, partial [Mesorhabditis belari]|uniref:Uncharacterized protein n=1 Tax=Mesorhabditis belari TaxID=2138241 RepID=A0AAF3F9I4_9BILA